jgi:hypothetical protein
MKLIDALRKKDLVTENGMPTNSTSLNACVDLFYGIGAMRNSSEEEINQLFLKAFMEDSEVAMKILFWARDVRGGAGERRVFKTILKEVAKASPKSIAHNVKYVPEYGRWDDLLCLVGTPLENTALTLIADALNRKNALCAKWMPRKGYLASKIRDFMGLTHKEYRMLLVSATSVVETKMCSKDWQSIEFSKVPSLAMSRYTRAFSVNGNENWHKYQNDLRAGKTKVNSGAVYPHDIIKSLRKDVDNIVAETQWESLENYMNGSTRKILPVVDVSGSMSCNVSGTTTAMDVAVALGLYISERNEGPFKNAFFTFSAKPTLQVIPDVKLSDKVSFIKRSDWGMNTDLQATFAVLLEKAKQNNIQANEMPDTILILSDMQFDEATCDTRRLSVQGGNVRGGTEISTWNVTAQEMMELMYDQSGYKMPSIVYWNLNQSTGVPVSFDTFGTALVSGFSPSIMTSILSGENFNPVSIMLETIGSDRYIKIES